MQPLVDRWVRQRPARTLVMGVRSETGFQMVWKSTRKGDRLMLILSTSQKVTLWVEPLDQYDNPARIDGMPTWALSDPSIGTLTPNADGLSAVFVTSGVLGLTQVSAQADADLGAGVRHIARTLDIAVEASEAVSLGLKAGVPEPK